MSDVQMDGPLSAAVPRLAIEIVDDGWQVIARLTGEADIAECGRLRDALTPHLGSGGRMVFDLSGVTSMDKAVMSVLEAVRVMQSARGGSCVLRNPSVAAHQLLSLSGLAKLFDTEIG